MGKACKQRTPEELLRVLSWQKASYNPTGWILLECQTMDSSRMGSLCILPYGSRASLQEIPTGPISPRGLASDMSVVVAVLLAEDLGS